MVTFNQNEAAAVDTLLRDLVNGPASPWKWPRPRRGAGAEVTIRRPFGQDLWQLDHIPLGAQGNVIAASELARLFRPRTRVPDYVVFYGCAGVINSSHQGRVFLVDSVNYLSLGTVDAAGSGACEEITLKNKWLCYTYPQASVRPLRQMIFPLVNGHGSLNVRSLTRLPIAQVAATDKVVRVKRGQAPAPVASGPPHVAYPQADWTYAQALDLVAQAGNSVLVEMESYGIARVAEALSILDRVVVMRVATDSLADHANSDRAQKELLMGGRFDLGRLLARLFAPSLYQPPPSSSRP